ncbi:hypothetical protein GCM10010359_23250 [Streptomyces morookaense]|nr:hypothetical protein GCM10010359_23250 [Streptomyces morookaense]
MSDPGTTAARQRLARAQSALLSSLVAGAPPPAGFDPGRVGAQRRALLDKRAGVAARTAPELREILGRDFRRLFLAHAQGRPMTDGYRRDALDFARALLSTPGAVPEPDRRRRLAAWVAERTAPPPRPGLLHRLATVLRLTRAAR